jgi:FixJ family two-component response regulator
MATAPDHPSTIFVVDDDPSVRTALERLLRCTGRPVRTFASAEAFLEQADHDECGCLILDVHLGQMSGIELQAHLVQQCSPIPVILTSGFDDGEAEMTALRMGATAFLRKPFEVSALLAATERGLCRTREARAARNGIAV